MKSFWSLVIAVLYVDAIYQAVTTPEQREAARVRDDWNYYASEYTD